MERIMNKITLNAIKNRIKAVPFINKMLIRTIR